MRTFAVYYHPSKGYEAVKKGFSWPGFFFTWIWAFVKKLPGIGSLLFLAWIIAHMLRRPGEPGAAALGILGTLAVIFLVGFKGNKWRERALIKRGYKLEETLKAQSPRTAIRKIAEDIRQYVCPHCGAQLQGNALATVAACTRLQVLDFQSNCSTCGRVINKKDIESSLKADSKRSTPQLALAGSPATEWSTAFKVIASLAVVGTVIGLLVSLGVANHKELARQRQIVSDVRPLIKECRKIGEVPVSIVGKCLVWDAGKDSRSRAYRELPSRLKAHSSDTAITVFMVQPTRNVLVGRYSISNEPAYRQFVDVCVAYWPQKKAAGMHSVVSREPRPSRPVKHAPEYGDPSRPVADWIRTLKRAK